MSTAAAVIPVPPPAPGRPPVDAENPWPGLAFFEERDRDFFHGRDDERQALLDLVAHQDLVLLYGPSGLGKTSLLRAGVLPGLPPSLLPVYLRLEFRHDADLTLQVFEAVERAARERDVEFPPRPAGGTLWEYFRRRDPACAFWGPGDRLVLPLLVFDQFEQLFTRDQEAMPQTVVDEFLTDLGDLVHGRIPAWLSARVSTVGSARARYILDSPGCKTLLSFREDFLADVARLTMLVPAIDRNALRLEPMRWTDAVKAVRQSGAAILTPLPAASEVGGAGDVAASIVDIVSGCDRTRQAAASVLVEPAILSVFCSELNDRRKARAADGGARLIDEALVGTQDASRIIARFYARAVKDAPLAITRIIETRLVIPPTPTAPTGARDSVAYEELDDAQRAAVAPLINEWRILRLEPVGRQRQLRLELTHDVLVRPVLEERRRSEERAKAEADAAAREREVKQRLERERQERLALEAKLEEQRQDQARTRRWLLTVGVVAAVAVLAVIAAYVGLEIAWAERERATRESAFSRRLALGPDIVQISELNRNGNYTEALAKAAALMRADPDNDSVRNLTANLLWHNSWWLPAADVTHNGTGSDCTSLFSPDGARSVTLCQFGTVVLWDPIGGQIVATLIPDGANAASFSPDGRLIATASFDGVVIWNAETGRQERPLRLRSGRGRHAVEFSPDGTRLVTLSEDRPPVVWSTDTWQELRVLPHTGAVRAAHFTADSQSVVTVADRLGARVWSLASARAPQTIEAPGCDDALPSPSGRWVACVVGSTFVLVDTTDARRRLQPQQPGAVTSLQWGGNDSLLGIQDGRVFLWSLAGSLVSTWPLSLPLGDAVLDAAMERGGRYVVALSGRPDGSVVVRVWDTEVERVVSSLLLPDDVRTARLDRSGRRLLTTGPSSARVWRLVTQAGPALELERADRVQFTSSGRWLVVEGWQSEGRSRPLSVLDAMTGTLTSADWKGAADAVSSLTTVVARDADRILVVSGSNAFVYDIDARGLLRLVRTTALPCDADASRQLASMDALGTSVGLACGAAAVIWNVASGSLHTLPADSDAILGLDVSPDGSKMAVTRSKSVQIVEAATGRGSANPIRSTADDRLVAAVFSADGRALLTTTAGGEVQRRHLDGTVVSSLAVGAVPAWIWFTSDTELLGTTTAVPPAVRLWNAVGMARKPLLPTPPIADFMVSRRDAAGRSGQRALSLFNNGRFTVSDVDTLHPETGELDGAGAFAARLGPDGTRVVLNGTRGVTVVDVPRTTRGDVEWLLAAAGHVTGFDIRSFDLLRARTDWLHQLQVRTRAANTAAPRSLQEKIERWLFEAPPARGN